MIGATINAALIIIISLATKPPTPEIQEMVEEIRYPQARTADQVIGS
ncbi:hypothetical protein [Nesterenkonia pannonica]|nr:hypothetical protein [Nesterenkonia pannonica]